MRDRLQAAKEAAAELAPKAQRLLPGEKTDVDDPSDDEEDAEPVRIDPDRSLFDDLREIDPTPPLPLVDVHEAGFASLIRRLDKVEGTGFTDHGAVRRILDLVGDRLSLSVGPDGITVRGSSAGGTPPGTTWST